MALENIGLNDFRQMVGNAAVLDGDIALVATGKNVEQQEVDLVKVNFGGKLRQIFSAAAGMKAEHASTNKLLREHFCSLLEQSFGGQETPETRQFMEQARQMLGIGDREAVSKPLSRMTVKVLLDRLDKAEAKAGEFKVADVNLTKRQLNALVDRIGAEATKHLREKGVTPDQLKTKLDFLRTEIRGLGAPDAGTEHLVELLSHDLEIQSAADALLTSLAADNVAGALDAGEIDASKFNFDVQAKKPEDGASIDQLRQDLAATKNAAQAPRSAKRGPSASQLTGSLQQREALLGRKDDDETVVQIKHEALARIDTALGKGVFEKVSAGRDFPASFLLDVAEGLEKKSLNADNLSAFIANNNPAYVNSNEVRTMMADPNVRAVLDKVSVPEPDRTDLERARSLVADLVFPEDTSLFDGSAGAVERLRSVLAKHADSVSDLLSGKVHLASLVMEPEMEIAAKELLEVLKGAGEKPDAAAIRSFVRTVDPKVLENAEQRILAAGELACQRQQDEVSALFRQFTGGGEVASPRGSREAPVSRGKLSLETFGKTEKTLDDYISGKGITGGRYGEFLARAVDTYFKSMPALDKRAMFSASLRYANTPEQKLAAFFKGAGPVFQKMLQGLPADFGDAKFRAALADMKSRLAPIPREIVKVQLADIVARSEGKIANIAVKKSLGAATVGEALLCAVTDDQGQTRDCVVKLLRPDAKLRSLREKDIFFTAAAKTPGMTEIFKSQFESIQGELDLTREAGHVQSGGIYTTLGAKMEVSVQSVRLNPDVKPTAVSMVMELAPGTTVDRLVEKVNKKVQAALNKLVELKPDGSFPTIPDPENSGREIVQYRVHGIQAGYTISEVGHELQEAYEAIRDAQAGLVDACTVWTQEALFGDGFIMGDMHSGNIMVDGKTVTIIDFGNSTRIPDKTKVVGFAAATGFREAGDVVRILSGMMDQGNPQAAELRKAADKYEFLRTKRDNPDAVPPENVDLGPNKYDRLMEELHTMLNLGGDEEAGRRLTAALKMIQDAGVEIPSHLVTFMQSQDRLEASVKSLNTLLGSIKTAFSAVTGNVLFDYMLNGSDRDAKFKIPKMAYDLAAADPDTYSSDKLTRIENDYRNTATNLGKTDTYASSIEMGVYAAFGAPEKNEVAIALRNGTRTLDLAAFRQGLTRDGVAATTGFMTRMMPIVHHNLEVRKLLQTMVMDKLDTFDDASFTVAVRDFIAAYEKSQMDFVGLYTDRILANKAAYGIKREVPPDGDVSSDSMRGEGNISLWASKKNNPATGLPEMSDYVVDVKKFLTQLAKDAKDGVFGPKPESGAPEFKSPRDFFDSLTGVIQNNKGKAGLSMMSTVGLTSGKYIHWAKNGKDIDEKPVSMKSA